MEKKEPRFESASVMSRCVTLNKSFDFSEAQLAQQGPSALSVPQTAGQSKREGARVLCTLHIARGLCQC